MMHLHASQRAAQAAPSKGVLAGRTLRRRRQLQPVLQAEGHAAHQEGARHELASVELFGVSADATLEGLAETVAQPLGPPPPGVEPIELPHQERLEQEFGRPLDHLEVLSGPTVEEALVTLKAEAAARGEMIFLADPQAPLPVVAHEVVHALQSQLPQPADEQDGLVEEEAPTEQEAHFLAEQVAEAQSLDVKVGEQEISSGLPESSLALLRADSLPSPSSPTSPQEEERFEEALQGETPGAAEAADEQKEAEAAQAEPPEGEAEAGAELEAELAEEGELPEEEPQPTFDLPEMPDTELSPEEEAARQAELAEAEAAIEQAEDAGGVVGAFADAPPSVKALTQSSISGRVGEVVQNDQQEFEAEMPEFCATMGGDLEGEEVPEVGAPEAGEADLEEGAVAPAPEPDLPPLPIPLPFKGNEFISGFLSRLFGGDPAQAIGKSLNEVNTTDPDIETSAGEKPKVLLEGETDPERIEGQHEAGIEQSQQERDKAMQAVLDGPGPEQAKLREMDEEVPVGELLQPQIEGGEPLSETEQFNQMELPESVTAQFDQDLGATMQANMTEARAKTEQAEGDRDTQRQQALVEAESQRDQHIEDADTEQRSQVLEARRTIQQERQGSIDAQQQAVQDLETEAETERAANQQRIQDRVKEDEETISAGYDQAELDAKDKVKGGEEDAEEERRAAEQEAENKSWWERAVDFVKEAFAALTAVINGIFDAVRSAVKLVLDAVRDAVKGLIDLAADFIKGAIEAYGAVLKGLVNGLLGDVFPGLAQDLTEGIDNAVNAATEAVDAAAETLKAGVDAVVDSLQAGLDAILDAFQSAINLALSVLEAALTGDWSGLVRKVLEAALRVLGIDPQAFFALVGEIVDTLQRIIDDPIGFLGNVVDAVVLGLQKFADDFLTHLKTGIIAWLTGALGDIQIPSEFSLTGLLDLARQILGLTWDWVRQKAVKLIGEKNVERIEFIFGYIQTLIEGGFPALFEQLKQDLTGLVETVMGAIKDFLVEKVIIAGITWLASLFSPVGALVKLLFTIWNFFMFLRDQLARMIQIVETVVASIANIAQGVIEGAATKVESVLANLLPVAIDLVAKLLGLTGVASKVRKVIGDIREKVDQAVDSLIDRVLRAFKGGGEGEEAAVEEEEAGAAALQVGEVMTVPVEEGPSHTLSITIAEKDATVMLASDPLPISQWLARFDDQIKKMEDGEPKTTAGKQLETTRGIFNRLDPQADAFLQQAQAQQGQQGQQTQPLDDSQVDKVQGELRDALSTLFVMLGGEGGPALDLLEFFKHQIEKSHDLARPSLEKILAEKQQEWQGLKWEEVRRELEENHDPFRKPLLKQHPFGTAVQKKIIEDLAAQRAKGEEGIPSPDQEAGFLSNYLVKDVHAGVFKEARLELRDVLFGEGSVESQPQLQAALQESMQRFQGKGNKADEDLVAAVSGKIIDFLTAVAQGDASYPKIELIEGKNLSEEWDKRLWGKKVNQGWIKDRFRKSGGEHEWIPTNYVGRVIERAKKSQVAEDSETAALWVTFQDAFRSPTGILMYNPQDSAYQRTVPYPRELQPPHEKKEGGQLTVLQGHVGAVHAPVSKENDYRDDVVAQTRGQGPWHNRLRKVFDDNFSQSNSHEGMRKIMQEITFFIADSMWFGDALPNPGFEEYYKATKGAADGKDISSFTTLQGVAKKAAEDIDKDFNKAREAVKI